MAASSTLNALLWRAASQAADLPEFLRAAVAALVSSWPVSRISLWVIEGDGGALSRSASSGDGDATHDHGSLPLSTSDRRRLDTWLRRGRPMFWKAGDPDEGPTALLADRHLHAGLALLPVQGASSGFLLMEFAAVTPLRRPMPEATQRERPELTARQQAKPTGALRLNPERVVATIAMLEGPLAAAMDHARQVGELLALRQAAEADRQALLRRLGREGLSDEIIGAASGLKSVLERVRLVARADLPVLIFGETGAGKEVIARAVHEQSPRADRPFIRVNCGAIPPDLIDSELFGHERGSFTGAVALRRGWFEQADSGTLFLDEIGDLPLPAQVRLLRVLQDGSLQRVGGQHTLHVDVRIVAATHRDLPALVERREFREDLWYRLASFPIFLPPLRERIGDIPALAEHFVRRAARRFGVPAATLTATDLARLASYSWPGNVRELASVIDRAVIVGEGRTLAIDLALGGPQPPLPVAGDSTRRRRPDESRVSGDALDEVMRRHIESVLWRTRGVIEGSHGAAAILRINPHTLRARMRKLKITWREFRHPPP